jgi:hypothetical protein
MHTLAFIRNNSRKLKEGNSWFTTHSMTLQNYFSKLVGIKSPKRTGSIKKKKKIKQEQQVSSPLKAIWSLPPVLHVRVLLFKFLPHSIMSSSYTNMKKTIFLLFSF